MNPLMTRYAERHQIALVVCAAIRERLDVMHKRRKDISPLLFAYLTERMPCQMSVTNPAPCAAISRVLIIPAREVVIVNCPLCQGHFERRDLFHLLLFLSWRQWIIPCFQELIIFVWRQLL